MLYSSEKRKIREFVAEGGDRRKAHTRLNFTPGSVMCVEADNYAKNIRLNRDPAAEAMRKRKYTKRKTVTVE